jgi:diguanylate cyclase (GGDEF)-like protein
MNKKSILVVDDDEMTRLLIRQALMSDIYDVIEAKDGVEGIELFNEVQPDLVLLDVDLPKLNGFEVCKLMRSSVWGKTTPIVMLTGMDDTDSIDKAYRLGATDFMVKPINWTLLAHHLRYVLRSSYYFESMKQSESRLEYAQQVAKLGHWELSDNNGQLLLSRQLAKMLSLSTLQFENGFDFLIELIHPDDRFYVKGVLQEAFNSGELFSLEVRIKLLNDECLYLHVQGELLANDEIGIIKLSGVMQDITELKQSQKQLVHVAHHDSLTNLPNRTLFQQHLERAMQRADRSHSNVALLFIDLDRFKNINDSLGHDSGDELLREVATRFSAEIRHYDMVARFGGDEFAIILDSVQQNEEVVDFVQRLKELLQKPFLLANKMIYIEASIGISLYPLNGKNSEELLRNADTAMYQAKRSEQYHFAFYSSELTDSTIRRWSLENDLHLSLKNKDFYLLYQPKVDRITEQISGVEALIRWNRKDNTEVFPSEFIPLAEETGLIISLGKWVIEEAVKQLSEWKDTVFSGLTIAVNVSGRQIYDEGFTDFIETVLAKAGISPKQLEIELTEEHLVSSNHEGKGLATLRKLDKLGISIAIDDFGTGYSSLSRLKRLPISTLKIDKSFVDHIPDNKQDVAIIKSIISLAKNLDIQVVAEGVEELAQLNCLQRYDCDLIQGYYYSKPVSKKEVEALCLGDNLKEKRIKKLSNGI